MIIDMDTATYLNAVVSALSAGKTFPDPQISNKCPECGDWLGYFNTGDHVVWDASTDKDTEKVIVIIACEGYWIIDPNLVGIMSDTWMSQDDPRFLGEELPPVGSSDTPAGVAPDGLGEDDGGAIPINHNTDDDNWIARSVPAEPVIPLDYPSLP